MWWSDVPNRLYCASVIFPCVYKEKDPPGNFFTNYNLYPIIKLIQNFKIERYIMSPFLLKTPLVIPKVGFKRKRPLIFKQQFKSNQLLYKFSYIINITYYNVFCCIMHNTALLCFRKVQKPSLLFVNKAGRVQSAMSLYKLLALLILYTSLHLSSANCLYTCFHSLSLSPYNLVIFEHFVLRILTFTFLFKNKSFHLLKRYIYTQNCFYNYFHMSSNLFYFIPN